MRVQRSFSLSVCEINHWYYIEQTKIVNFAFWWVKMSFEEMESNSSEFLWYLTEALPHYDGEIWKCSVVSTVRPTVYTNPSRKRSFISTVRPTIHTNPSRKRSFISTVRSTVHSNPSRKRSFSKTCAFAAGGFWNLRPLRVLVRTEDLVKTMMQGFLVFVF